MSEESASTAERAGIRVRPLVAICLCFAAGIVAGGIPGVPAWVWAAAFLISVVGVSLGRNSRAFFAAVLAGCFFGGAAWYGLRAMPLPDDVSHCASQQPAEIRGYVVERRVRSEGRVSLKVRVHRLRTLEGERTVSGITVVYPGSDTDAHPGEDVRCVGRVQRPPGPWNWGQFSYQQYLEEHGIHSVFFAETVEAMPAEKGPAMRALVSWLRRPSLSSLSMAGERTLARWVGRAQETIHARIAAALPARNRSLVATVLCGLLFGDKSYPLPEGLEEAFRRSGTIHIIVVSGTQVSFIAFFVLFLMRRSPLPPWAGSLLAAGFLFLYVVTVGATPSVLRAALMAALTMVAAVSAGQRDLYTSLAFALLVLLILNPASLFDVGLQLSFLATFGIVALALPAMKAVLGTTKPISEPSDRSGEPAAGVKGVPWPGNLILGIAAVTVSTQIMVAPALAYYFHRFTLVAFLANLVVLPCVAPLMLLGVGLLVFSFVSPLAASALGTIAAPILEFTVRLVSDFAQWPSAAVGQVGLSMPEVLALYAALFGVMSLLLKPVRRAITRERAILATTVLAVAGGVWLVAKSSPQTLSMTALNVERGFCAVAQTPAGASLIIDGGGPASERWNAGETIILPFLLQERIRRVDAIVVTDFDHDHTSGLAPVISEMPVGKLLVTGSGDASSSSDRMLHAAQQKGVEVLWAASQQRLEVAEDVRLTPGASPALGGDGAHFLLLSYGNVDFIWAIEADKTPLLNLPQSKGKRVVLFLPVRTQLTAELERMLVSGPVAGVVLSPRNRFDTLDPAFQALIISSRAKVFRTDLDGAVRVETDGQSLKFRTFKGGR